MFNSLTTKLEIKVANERSLDDAIKLAMANCIPALVVDWRWLPRAITARGLHGAKFRLIVEADWLAVADSPQLLARSITSEALLADGFELDVRAANPTKLLANYRFVRTTLIDSRPDRLIRLAVGTKTPAPALISVLRDSIIHVGAPHAFIVGDDTEPLAAGLGVGVALREHFNIPQKIRGLATAMDLDAALTTNQAMLASITSASAGKILTELTTARTVKSGDR